MTAKTERNEAPQPIPDGFERHELLLASVAAAAEYFDVTPRTIRNWISGGAPAIRLRKKPPLIHVPTLERWLEAKREYDWDFGRHGGVRWW